MCCVQDDMLSLLMYIICCVQDDLAEDKETMERLTGLADKLVSVGDYSILYHAHVYVHAHACTCMHVHMAYMYIHTCMHTYMTYCIHKCNEKYTLSYPKINYLNKQHGITLLNNMTVIW